MNDFGYFNLTLICNIIGLVFHPGWCYFFVIHLNYELIGIAYAMTATSIITYGSLLYFTHSQPSLQPALFWPDFKSCTTDLGLYLRVAIPNTVMISLDWWSFELFALVSGYLGVTSQSAFVILMNVQSAVYQFGKGFDIVTCSIIG